ncbi:MAG TPA: MFS transporter [Gemmatimonadaceae bacterium]|nr:MFS transporter [Gemmatimonadaceae bacterium]
MSATGVTASGVSATTVKPTRVRFGMLGLLLLATTINYVDRSNLSIVAPFLSKELGLDPVQMGLLFSAFAWSYAIANLPGGYVIDRFGSRIVYGVAQFAWSAATVGLGIASGFLALFGLRFAVGLAEAPAFPVNNRVVSSWFPQRERGRATSTYAMGQYIGSALLSPVLFWMATNLGWRSVFWVTGMAGIASALIWFRTYRDPEEHARVNAAELEMITAGGALTETPPKESVTRVQIARLLRERQVWALGLGKFAVMSSLYFLLTWFPTYLVNERGLTSLKAGAATSLPYIAASIGVMLGGVWSDWLLRRGSGISAARKIPIVTGFLGASSIILVNYVEGTTLALAILTFAFFAQGVSSNSWSIIAEVAPRNLMGTTGGIINFTGQLAGIVTPILIGFILRETQSFELVLAYVSLAGLVGALSYTVLIGKIHRIEM